MTSYDQFARLVEEAMLIHGAVCGTKRTVRNEVIVNLASGETFMLSPMILNATEVDRLGVGGMQ